MQPNQLRKYFPREEFTLRQHTVGLVFFLEINVKDRKFSLNFNLRTNSKNQ